MIWWYSQKKKKRFNDQTFVFVCMHFLQLWESMDLMTYRINNLSLIVSDTHQRNAGPPLWFYVSAFLTDHILQVLHIQLQRELTGFGGESESILLLPRCFQRCYAATVSLNNWTEVVGFESGAWSSKQMLRCVLHGEMVWYSLLVCVK